MTGNASSSPAPESVARSYLASFATGDPDRIAAHVADDFANEHTAALGAGCIGRDAYRERLPNFLASMPGLHYEVIDVVTDGATAVVRYTLRAEVNQRPIAVPGAMWIETRDGLIGRRVDYWDSLVFLRQAGLDPAQPARPAHRRNCK